MGYFEDLANWATSQTKPSREFKEKVARQIQTRATRKKPVRPRALDVPLQSVMTKSNLRVEDARVASETPFYKKPLFIVGASLAGIGIIYLATQD